MCGIAGIFRRRAADPADGKRLAAMTASLVHRGPDDHGYLLLDSRDGRFTLEQDSAGDRADVLLGNRRLSIIDTSAAGRQPMANETRDVFLVFNGEIYNYVELGRELRARGHRFASESDTEVVVHAYEEWGTACVGRFNGMWAFALWDQRRRRLFCSRDRFGAKPFYYFIDDEVFIFASEIKAILGALPNRPAPDYGSIRAFLTQSLVCRPKETFFENISRLPAAHSLTVSRDRTETARYWDYGAQTHDYDYRRPEQTFAELLDDAVRLRLRSDVPVGVALSGGVDSSLVTALARRHLRDRELKVFTAAFPGTKHDELRYAELVARRFGAEIHTVEYRATSLVEDLARVVWHMDHPAVHGQVLPRWQVMDLAARHVKVVLEGQGSDEILAGYPTSCFGPWARDQIARATAIGMIPACGRVALAAIEHYRRHRTIPFRNLTRRARRALRWHARANGTLLPEFRERARAAAPAGFESAGGSRLAAVLRRDHERTVLPTLLMFGDAISMGRSLESRLPFLDYRLVEFMFALPDAMKYDGVESKIILKRAFRDLLPPEIAARKDKIGFRTPMMDWVGPCLDSEVRPLLLSERARSRGIFAPNKIEEALARAARRDEAVAGAVFRWLALEIWFRLYIDGDDAPRGPSLDFDGGRV